MSDLRYMISDAAKLLEVESHVLRYWEEELELQIPRNELGHRYYKDEQIMILKNIKLLKEQGLQLRAIKMLLPNINMGDTLPVELEKEFTTTETTLAEPNNKVKQFQTFMKQIIEESLKSNNEALKQEIKKEVSEELGGFLRTREEIEEKRYKKLDETLREIQKMRQEAAISTNKRSFFSLKRKNKNKEA